MEGSSQKYGKVPEGRQPFRGDPLCGVFLLSRYFYVAVFKSGIVIYAYLGQVSTLPDKERRTERREVE